MTDKRIPPWERARINFRLAENKRARTLEEKERPLKARLFDLEENRERLARITKDICPDCRHYIFSEGLSEGEKKIGERSGFCICEKRQI